MIINILPQTFTSVTNIYIFLKYNSSFDKYSAFFFHTVTKNDLTGHFQWHANWMNRTGTLSDTTRQWIKWIRQFIRIVVDNLRNWSFIEIICTISKVDPSLCNRSLFDSSRIIKYTLLWPKVQSIPAWNSISRQGPADTRRLLAICGPTRARMWSEWGRSGQKKRKEEIKREKKRKKGNEEMARAKLPFSAGCSRTGVIYNWNTVQWCDPWAICL